MALLVDVWLFMVLPTVYALTKSVLPISQGAPLGSLFNLLHACLLLLLHGQAFLLRLGWHGAGELACVLAVVSAW